MGCAEEMRRWMYVVTTGWVAVELPTAMEAEENYNRVVGVNEGSNERAFLFIYFFFIDFLQL